MIDLEQPPKQNSVEEEEESNEMASDSKRVKHSNGQRTMPEYCVGSVAKKVSTALAKFVIETATPISICENPALRELLDTIVIIGREAQKNCLPFTMKDILTSRKPFTETVDTVCVDVFEQFEQFADGVRKEAVTYGCTLVQDGRSNVCRDSLIASGVQGRSGFIALGSVNAEATKKDADYLCELIEDYLDDNRRGSGFGGCIVAVVLDGAAANIKAMRKVNQTRNLLVVRCQAHALALLIKKMLLKHFRDVTKKADTLITFIRNHGRVHSLLKLLSGGLTVLRFVETRFNTHPVALARLCQLRSALSTMVGDKRYCTYIAEANKNTRTQASEVNGIIVDSKFWDEAKLALEICMPITIALRHMDKSAVRSRHVHMIWSSLAGHLVQVLKHPSWKRVPEERRKAMFRTYNDEWVNAHYPLMSAAYVLNPANLDDVKRMLEDVFNGRDVDHWTQFNKDTLDCLRTLTKRLFPEEADAKFAIAKRDLAHYFAGTGPFEGAVFTKEDTIETYFVSNLCLLAKLAMMIHNVVCSVSNIERLHKVYSNIHTAERNQLLAPRVDRLVKANLALRMDRVQATQEKTTSEILGHLHKEFTEEDQSILAFTTLTPEIEADLEAWMSLYVQSDVQISQSINVSTMAPPSVATASVVSADAVAEPSETLADGSEEETAANGSEEGIGAEGVIVCYEEDVDENENFFVGDEVRHVPNPPVLAL